MFIALKSKGNSPPPSVVILEVKDYVKTQISLENNKCFISHGIIQMENLEFQNSKYKKPS